MLEVKKSNGYIALTTILVIGAVTTVIATSMLLISTITKQNALLDSWTNTAQINADTCSEVALWTLRKDPDIAVSETLTLSKGTCTYEIIFNSSSQSTINTEGKYQESVKRQKYIIQKQSHKISIVEYSEISDF